MELIINLSALLFFISEIILFIVKRSKAKEVKIRKDKSSMLILWIVISVSIFCGIYFGHLFPNSREFLFLVWVGLGLLFVGFAIRWAAILQLKKGFTVDVSISKHHKLKDDGLYKNIRHPSYLGLILQFLGLSLLFNSWLTLLIITIPVFLALAYRIKVEEELLCSAFGEEYENYKKRTKRILPGIF